MTNRPILRKSKLNEQPADYPAGLILDGPAPPDGTPPAERELSVQYEVSTSVVREALQHFAVMGLIDIRHGISR